MKKLSFLFILLAAIMTQSCTPKMTTVMKQMGFHPLPEKQEVYVLQPGESVPENSQYITELDLEEKDGNGEKDDIKYTLLLEACKVIARQMGANYIAVTKVEEPNADNPGYRIKGHLYHNLEAPRQREALSSSTSFQDSK